MRIIDTIYINGAFVSPKGQEIFELVNPTHGAIHGKVTLGDARDTVAAIAAAKRAFPSFSQKTVEERIQYLTQIHRAVLARREDLIEAMLEEYGAPRPFVTMAVDMAINNPLHAIRTLKDFAFERQVGTATVRMEALGVVGIITPWNSSSGFVTGKLSTAIAAGCTAVIKPSEMSATQTQILSEALHEAGLPPGVFNIVNGRGDIVGAELTRHPDIAKISFTGSTLVGKTIARGAVDTLKRVTLELGGKSPNILLDDADFETAIPLALTLAYMNNGQACVAGTRLLVPESRLNEAKDLLKVALKAVQLGDPSQASTTLGPLVSRKQWERVQSYIQKGLDEGAELLAGGPGKPSGFEQGNFVKPTIFWNVRNDMTIAQEEIFGPVLSVISYTNEEDALRIANETSYGLQSYISTRDIDRARELAKHLQSGRVVINGAPHEPEAPFGGFKQSGLGREFGSFGLEAYLEPKAILGLTSNRSDTYNPQTSSSRKP